MLRFILAIALVSLTACGMTPVSPSETRANSDIPVVPMYPNMASQGPFNVYLSTPLSTQDDEPSFTINYIGGLCNSSYRYTIGIVQPGVPVKMVPGAFIGRGICAAATLSVKDLNNGPIGLFLREDTTGKYDSDYGRNFNFILQMPH